MSPRTFRIWSWLHKWSSLICTLFMLLLCLTGLPLIFHHEIEDGFTERSPVDDSAPTPTVQSLVDRAVAERPGEKPAYLIFDHHESLLMVMTADPSMAPPDAFHYLYYDMRDGQRVERGQPNEGFMHIMLRLHMDMFAGLPGMLFLGAMGLLLMVAIVSGVVLYAPFMRRLDFGTVRADRSTRVRWLDLHNLLGTVTVVWLSVVTLTGVINTLAMPIEQTWQVSELAEMIRVDEDRPPLGEPVSADRVLAAVGQQAGHLVTRTVAYPGTPFSGSHHFGVYLVGDSAVTSRVLTPAVVDAETGVLTDIREMPLYVKGLFVSQPLHFGDYGGLPLKILWALLDLVTIVVLVSGLYLWLSRRRRRASGRQADDPPAGDL